jgi:hypothetical protein
VLLFLLDTVIAKVVSGPILTFYEYANCCICECNEGIHIGNHVVIVFMMYIVIKLLFE